MLMRADYQLSGMLIMEKLPKRLFTSSFNCAIKPCSIHRFVERSFNYEKRWDVECRATTTTYRFLHDIANAEYPSLRGEEKMSLGG